MSEDHLNTRPKYQHFPRIINIKNESHLVKNYQEQDKLLYVYYLVFDENYFLDFDEHNFSQFQIFVNSFANTKEGLRNRLIVHNKLYFITHKFEFINLSDALFFKMKYSEIIKPLSETEFKEYTREETEEFFTLFAEKKPITLNYHNR